VTGWRHYRSLSDQLQIARNHHQQFVEIIRDAASQLTDKVEFLGMPKHCFRLAAIGNLVVEAPVGLGELARSLDDQLLEIAIDAPSFLLRGTHAEQRTHRGD
jgi:hypothetical protein